MSWRPESLQFQSRVRLPFVTTGDKVIDDRSSYTPDIVDLSCCRIEPMRASLGRAARASLADARVKTGLSTASSLMKGDISNGQEGPRRGSADGRGLNAKQAPAGPRPLGTWGRPSTAPAARVGMTGPGRDPLSRSTQVCLFQAMKFLCL